MQNVTLITGPTSGIGLELCKVCAEHTHDLLLVSRNQKKLDELAEELRKNYSVKVWVYAADLSDPSSCGKMWDWAMGQGLHIDILINNAGFATRGFFSDTDPEEASDMLELNIKTLSSLTRRALPGMIEQKFGRILNVASTAAFQPGPYMAGYYASKAFVLSFSEAIANELQGTGVTVTCLCPGPTKTAFYERAGLQENRLFKGTNVMDAETVARIGYDAMQKGKAVSIVGHRNTWGAVLNRFVPRGVAAKVVRRIQESN